MLNEQMQKKLDYVIEENRVLKSSNKELERELLNMQAQRDLSLENYMLIRNSSLWKMTKPVRESISAIRKLKLRISSTWSSYMALIKKIPFVIKNRGLKYAVNRMLFGRKAVIEYTQNEVEATITAGKEDIWERLNEWIDSTPHDFIDIFGVPMGWNTPLFQRFQHISLQAGKVGGISFYGAHPAVDKEIEVYKLVSPSLCIVNLENYQVRKRFFELMDMRSELKYIRVQSIDLATTIEDVKGYLAKGYEIVYEYIDELTPQITGTIPDFVFKRHEYILKNEDITVVATSDKLFGQITPYRNKNMEMINNGVDYQHWNIKKENLECPEDIKKVVEKEKIIVGYHGALAKWVDYELLKTIADDGRFTLLLIGHEHDENLKNSGLLKNENVYFIGAKPYNELNRYAAFYDIAILPFIVNDITLSVSPVKIFEYMALEKPVVTYALPECKKYKSCLCADTREEFMEQLNEAIALREDIAYKNSLKEDALANTWESITARTVELVKKHHYNKMVLKDIKQEKYESVAYSVINGKLTEEDRERYMNQIMTIPAEAEEDYVSLSTDQYERKEKDAKIIAYYLTQFHPDSHNEKWWGKGVTEWNNVSRAIPQFVGHYQPRFPGELGYYDLRIIDQMKRQVELAKMYGIYGFSFYYYWFDGERLLEQPLEMFLEHKEIDFPFSLCWANENWTRRYDGTNSDILMEQPTSVESYKNVIDDMMRFLSDERYIEIAGKKVITVYRPSLMPKVKEVLKYWREICKKNNIGEIYLIAVKENMVERDWLKEGYDAVSEFHPGTLYKNCKNITSEIKYIRNDFAGEVFSYEDIVREKKYFNYDYPKLYRAVMPMWDNTARRNNKGMIFHGSTPELYKEWLMDVMKESQSRRDIEESVIFINAWNEWGEGAYLEPDRKYGYAYLDATRKTLESLHYAKDIVKSV